ncbi:hypothetical protein [Kineosporia babensis]|uniref:Uncharacterized protein n=1 Tax=Kineosporia babensis TaxID=499548 RepID=A0A9X1SU47_9ACTN|nr:hypothetical protein [Kineosporia babensis]MCD5312056.1 hypothetical protein [Kineosporia babensis]
MAQHGIEVAAHQIEFQWRRTHGFNAVAASLNDEQEYDAIRKSLVSVAETPQGQRLSRQASSVVLQVTPVRRAVIYRQYNERPGEGDRAEMSARALVTGRVLNEGGGTGLLMALGLLAGGTSIIGATDSRHEGSALPPVTPEQVQLSHQYARNIISREGDALGYPASWRRPLITMLLDETSERLWIAAPPEHELVGQPGNWQARLMADVLWVVFPILSALPADKPGWAYSFSSYEDQRTDRSNTGLPRVIFLGPPDPNAPGAFAQLPGRRLKLERAGQPPGSSEPIWSRIAPKLVLAMDRYGPDRLSKTLQENMVPTPGKTALWTAERVLDELLQSHPSADEPPYQEPPNSAGPSPYQNPTQDEDTPVTAAAEPRDAYAAPPSFVPTRSEDRMPATDTRRPALAGPDDRLARKVETAPPGDALATLMDYSGEYVEKAWEQHGRQAPRQLTAVANRLLVPRLSDAHSRGPVMAWLARPATPAALVRAIDDTGIRDPERSLLNDDDIRSLDQDLERALGRRWFREHAIFTSDQSSDRSGLQGSSNRRRNLPRYLVPFQGAVSGLLASLLLWAIALLAVIVLYQTFTGDVAQPTGPDPAQVTLQQELDQQKAELAQRERDAQTQKEGLDQRQETLDERQEELNGRIQDVTDRENAVQEKEEALQSQTSQNDSPAPTDTN